MEKKVVERLKNGLIVSCQAYEGDPLFGSEVMAKMAIAAEQGGAVGIRANGIDDIQSIGRVTALPMIGIVKAHYRDSEVYITPTFKELEMLGKTNVEIIALDGTNRPRPDGHHLKDMIDYIKSDLNKLVMADVSTLEEAIKAASYGADFVGTTLSGYTENTKNISGPDWHLIEELVKKLDVPIIAEGKIMTGAEAARALALGCHSVCVGAAITRPEVITNNFVTAMNQIREK